MSWSQDRTIVAGADLSAQQYKLVNYSGVLVSSAMNQLAGALQNKPLSGEHAACRWIGVSRVYAAASLGSGAYVGPSATTSGGIALVTSGGMAIGITRIAINSGYSGEVDLFGGITYLK